VSEPAVTRAVRTRGWLLTGPVTVKRRRWEPEVMLRLGGAMLGLGCAASGFVWSPGQGETTPRARDQRRWPELPKTPLPPPSDRLAQAPPEGLETKPRRQTAAPRIAAARLPAAPASTATGWARPWQKHLTTQPRAAGRRV